MITNICVCVCAHFYFILDYIYPTVIFNIDVYYYKCIGIVICTLQKHRKLINSQHFFDVDLHNIISYVIIILAKQIIFFFVYKNYL